MYTRTPHKTDEQHLNKYDMDINKDNIDVFAQYGLHISLRLLIVS